MESTLGVIAEVDFFDYQTIAGVVWPTRYYERLLKPIPNLHVHDWRLTGIDFNRRLSGADIADGVFSSKCHRAGIGRADIRWHHALRYQRNRPQERFPKPST